MLHIELTKWADLLLIAPMSADCLAKIACGICSELLTCVVRAWPPDKPVLMAAALHGAEWRHPVTLEHLQALRMQDNMLFATNKGDVVSVDGILAAQQDQSAQQMSTMSAPRSMTVLAQTAVTCAQQHACARDSTVPDDSPQRSACVSHA